MSYKNSLSNKQHDCNKQAGIKAFKMEYVIIFDNYKRNKKLTKEKKKCI